MTLKPALPNALLPYTLILPMFLDAHTQCHSNIKPGEIQPNYF